MAPRGAKIAPRGPKIAPRWPEDAHKMIVFLNRYRKTCNKSDRTGPFFSFFFGGGAVFLNRYRMTSTEPQKQANGLDETLFFESRDNMEKQT